MNIFSSIYFSANTRSRSLHAPQPEMARLGRTEEMRGEVRWKGQLIAHSEGVRVYHPHAID